MSSMSSLSIDIRRAEENGERYFATEIYADPVNSNERVWAIFDVEAARTSEHGIAFVRSAPGNVATGTLRAIEQAVTRLNEGN